MFRTYNEIWEKIRYIIKEKLIVSLCIIKISKAEKKSMQKKVFNVILIDLIYRKGENYYLKVFLEKSNSHDSYNAVSDEEYFDHFDDSSEKNQKKKIPSKKIQTKKIKSIDIFLDLKQRTTGEV